LDTETLTILEDYIETFGGAVITVSHDRYFLNKVAQEYWYIHDGKMERIIGTFEDYEAYKKEQDKAQAQQKQQKQQAHVKQNANKKKGLSFKEKQEYETIIERIETTEQRLETIDEEMVAASSDYAKIKELNEEQRRLNQTYEDDMARWSELEELKEQ
ncbi:MAG: ABC transporter ATP-binding protein, partial [Staphylococcus equorum]|nr:ABC transporter ATP-binding protein [Staphylococcus equorum]